MDVTNRFVLDFALRHGGRVLDYGCGAGALVEAGRKAGLDIVGADVFYGGSSARADAERAGLLNTSIFEIAKGRLPFPDSHFDVIVNNQVMEHVENLDATLAEIHRVLRPGGTVLSVFPSRDVWREGHIGIPFSHWFGTGSRLRLYYTWLLRSLGFGYWKEQAPTPRAWAEQKLAWIDGYTRYRSRAEIFAAYRRYFVNEFREPDYIRYRLRTNSRRAFLVRVMDVPGICRIGTAIFRKLAFLVIVSRKA
ncbi:MAG TPA: methyltransferase domain-containing protein [Bryobacteraceae bacterium]|nr:methyltransferase domain-containing protein [Bryobacteraceae bacterium]